MSLEPVDTTPGLWRIPGWTPGTRGLYAIVVGASFYPHLAGGNAAAHDTFQLEQLVSSAGTAAKFFEWLRTSFQYADLEVVWCELLLAPTPAENELLELDGVRHWALPTNRNVRDAIQRWTGNLPKQPADAQASRTVFFFSGHGVQANSVPLLLPSDYLDPQFGDPQLENCISVRELRRWMEESPVGEHLALLDACRNEFSPLAQKGATAHAVFPVNLPGGPAPKSWAVLSATSPSKVAYQSPTKRLSFFGQAVLEGLQGLKHSGSSKLEFFQLVGYVLPRVNELLKEATRAPLEQGARQINEAGERLVVTELELDSLETDALELGSFNSFGELALDNEPESEASVEIASRALDARFDKGLAVHEPRLIGELVGNPEAFRRFGHEYASEIWRKGHVTLRSLRTGESLQGDLDARLLQVERDPPSSLVRIDLALPRYESGVLLVFEGVHDVKRERLAVALPTDGAGAVPVRLTLTFGPLTLDSQPMLQTIHAGFGPLTAEGDLDAHDFEERAKNYSYLWELHREADLGSLEKAAIAADPQKLIHAVEMKVLNPTAAIAGGLLLAQAGRIAQVEDWPRNMMNWFKETPDGAVLWAEALRTAWQRGERIPFGVEDPVQEAARALRQLLTRGLPFLAGLVELADRQARWLVRQDVSPELQGEMRAVRNMIQRALDISLTNGHFMVFTGLPRPRDMPGTGALSTEEILSIIRPSVKPPS